MYHEDSYKIFGFFNSFYLLVLCAGSLCKQFGPRYGPVQNIGPDLDPNCMTLRWYSRKNFRKSWFWIKSADNKKKKNFPASNELIHSINMFFTICIFFSKLTFFKNTFWIIISSKVLLGMIWVKTFCKNYQQTELTLCMLGNFSCFWLFSKSTF